MTRCIFCLGDNDQLTEEHVFPAALGGNLILKNATCVNCNNGFSKAFEQTIANRLTDFRLMLQIPDRYGKVPEANAKAEVDGKDLDAKVLQDGSVRVKPIVTVVKGKDGTTEEVLFQYGTDRQKKNLRQEAKEKGWEFMEGTLSTRESVISISGELDFIGSQEALRTAAKIAYTWLALKMGSEFAMRDMFENLRVYVLTGTGEPRAKLFFNEGFLNACNQGPHQHSIVLVGRRDKHLVDAVVRLFGGLCYFVNLTGNYEGADFYNTLVYDAQRGAENKVLVSHIQNEFLQIEDVTTSNKTIWNDMVVSGKWFLQFVDQAIRSKIRE